MSFFRSIIPEKREFSYTRWVNALEAGYGSLFGQTAAGINVDENEALKWSVVWGCVLYLAQDVAKTPLPTFRRLGPNSQEEARDYELWDIFQVAANPETTAYQFRLWMQAQLNIHGNAYAVIERDRRTGKIIALWQRYSTMMHPKVQDNGTLVYEFDDPSTPGPPKPIPSRNVFHLRGFSIDGVTGKSPVAAFREGIGVGLAYQAHAGYSFRNSVRPSLIGTTAAGPAKAKEFADAISQQMAGITKTGGVLIGYGGMDLKPWGFNNRDAEFISSRRFSVEEGCRIWRMPPSKLMDTAGNRYANVVAADNSYVRDTISPHQKNWEQAIALQLMTPEDRQIYYVEHDNSDLLKGTPYERARTEATQIQNGIRNINEVRAGYNLNPVEGGDENRTQMQMVPLSSNPGTEVTQS